MFSWFGLDGLDSKTLNEWFGLGLASIGGFGGLDGFEALVFVEATNRPRTFEAPGHPKLHSGLGASAPSSPSSEAAASGGLLFALSFAGLEANCFALA